jgi:O-antigen ligase
MKKIQNILTNKNIALFSIIAMIFIGFSPVAFATHAMQWGFVFLFGITYLILSLKNIFKTSQINIDKIELFGLIAISYMFLSFLWSGIGGHFLIIFPKVIFIYLLFIFIKRYSTLNKKNIFENNLLFIIPSILILYIIALGLLFPARFGNMANENFIVDVIYGFLPFSIFGISKKTKKLNLLYIFSIISSFIYFSINGSKEDFVLPIAAVIIFVCLKMFNKKLWAKFSVLTGLAIAGISVFAYSFSYLYQNIPSFTARIVTHINSFYLFLNSPIFGNGIGSTPRLYPKYQQMHTKFLPDIHITNAIEVKNNVMLEATHDEFFQTLIEFGVIGFILIFGLVGYILFKFIKQEQKTKADIAAFSSVSILSLVALLSYVLQNPASLTIAIICMGILSANIKTKSFKINLKEIHKKLLLFISVLFICLSTYNVCGQYYIESKYPINFAAFSKNPKFAFMERYKQYKLMPYDRQVAGSLFILLENWHYQALKTLRFSMSDWDWWSPENAESFYKISERAMPYNPRLKLFKISYLTIVGAKENSKEIEKLLSELEKQIPLSSKLYLTKAFYYSSINDFENSFKALDKGESLTTQPEELEEIQKTRELIKEKQSKNTL